MKSLLLRAPVIVALGLLAACASVVDGTSQTITVNTDPDGAVCEMNRDGKQIGVVNPTPGSLGVDKDRDDIALTCRKDGFLTETASISSTFTGATFGNIILGGGIGILVDAASGANNRYPERVDLVLTPEVFRSDAEIDAHFARLRDRADRQADALLETLKKDCEDGIYDAERCAETRAEIEAKRKSEYGRIAEARRGAKIGSNAPRPTSSAAPATTPTRRTAAVTSTRPAAAPVSSRPTCAEQAEKLGLSLANHGCARVLMATTFSVGRECEGTYNVPAGRRGFQAGDQLLTTGREYSVSNLPGLVDASCFKAIPGTWAFAKDASEVFIIIEGIDPTIAWCRGGVGC